MFYLTPRLNLTCIYATVSHIRKANLSNYRYNEGDIMTQELYNRPDIYDIVYKKENSQELTEHYKNVLGSKSITTIHDCSIGTGQLTFALCDLGYKVSGSDLSGEMLENARRNAEDRDLEIDLLKCDFREIAKSTNKTFDCVMSTGNSLAHVSNEDVKRTLESMTQLVADGGYIYLDTRNWDKILDTKQRFFCYNPFFRGEERINLTQVWDYISEEQIVFNLLYTFEKKNRIYKQEEVRTTYHPLRKAVIIDHLNGLGYEEVELDNFMNPNVTEFSEMDWYSICAKKRTEDDCN